MSNVLLKPTLSVSEAAAFLGVSRATLYNTVARGECPLRVIRVGKLIRFSTAEVHEVLGIRRPETVPA